jgi:hypothetical protein
VASAELWVSQIAVNSANIKSGTEYGLRDNPTSNEPLQRVKALERMRGGKWRVEWIEPTPGLTDFVKAASVIVPWRYRREYLADERRHAALVEFSRSVWPGKDHPVESAVSVVFEATGEEVLSIYGRAGVLDVAPDAIQRIADRSGISIPESTYSYTDRWGILHLPFDLAMEVAKTFAANEPETVLLHVDVEERELEVEAHEVGNANLVPLLEQRRAVWALVRQWAGFDEAVASREREIERLRRVVSDAVYMLKRHGLDDDVRRLERKLRAE